MLYLLLLGSCNICIIYLQVIKHCLKPITAVFYFYHSKIPSAQFTQGTITIIPWFINIFIIFLHVIEAYLKVTIAMFCFCRSKSHSNIMKNSTDSISIYIFKKLRVNKYKKQICHKENKFLFFDVMKTAQIFLQIFVIFNMILSIRFFFSGKMGNIRTCFKKETQPQVFSCEFCEIS